MNHRRHASPRLSDEPAIRSAIDECAALVERCRLLSHHLAELRCDGGERYLPRRAMDAAGLLDATREALEASRNG